MVAMAGVLAVESAWATGREVGLELEGAEGQGVAKARAREQAPAQDTGQERVLEQEAVRAPVLARDRLQA